MDMAGLSGAGYATLDFDRYKIDTVLSVTRRRYEMSRLISYTTGGLGVSETARSRTHGTDVAMGMRLRTPVLSRRDGRIELIGGATALLSQTDGYEETGSSGFNLVVHKQSDQIVYGEFGARGERSIKTNFGSITFRLDALYVLESGLGSRRLIAGFAADPLRRSTILLRSNQDKDPDQFSLGAGVSADLGKLTIDTTYHTIVGRSNAELHEVVVTLRTKF